MHSVHLLSEFYIVLNVCSNLWPSESNYTSLRNCLILIQIIKIDLISISILVPLNEPENATSLFSLRYLLIIVRLIFIFLFSYMICYFIRWTGQFRLCYLCWCIQQEWQHDASTQLLSNQLQLTSLNLYKRKRLQQIMMSWKLLK